MITKKDLKKIAKDIIWLHNASWWIGCVIYDFDNNNDKEFKEFYEITKKQAIKLSDKYIDYLSLL